MKQISAGIIIYRQTEEGLKFLLLYHGHNYWNFPKGKIEENERQIQTAFREVEEETGISSRDLRLVKNFKASEKFTFHDRESKNKVFKIVTFYLAETKKKQVKNDERDEGYGWFRLSEAKQILGKHKNTFEILSKADRLIKNVKNRNRYYQKRGRSTPPSSPLSSLNNQNNPLIKTPPSKLPPDKKI